MVKNRKHSRSDSSSGSVKELKVPTKLPLKQGGKKAEKAEECSMSEKDLKQFTVNAEAMKRAFGEADLPLPDGNDVESIENFLEAMKVAKDLDIKDMMKANGVKNSGKNTKDSRIKALLFHNVKAAKDDAEE